MPAAVTLPSRTLASAAILGVGFAIGWAPVALVLAARWNEPQYSHAWLVPFLAAGLVWARRAEIPADLRGNPLGLGFILVGLVLQSLGIWWSFDPLTAVSLVPAAAGCCLLLGGWPLARIAAPAIGFLIFLAPLPWSVETIVSSELQQLAAAASAAVLRVIGIPAVAQGAMLDLPSTKLGVAEACSGLRMLMVMSALTTAMAFIARRPRPVQAALILSGLPIALFCNVVRITATAFVIENFGRGTVTSAVHDVAGWLMIPLALVLIALEVRLMDRFAGAALAQRPRSERFPSPAAPTSPELHR